jgi:hypothetical protein
MFRATLLKSSGVSPRVRGLQAQSRRGLIRELVLIESHGIVLEDQAETMRAVPSMARALIERWEVTTSESVPVDLSQPELYAMIEDCLREAFEDRLLELGDCVERWLVP